MPSPAFSCESGLEGDAVHINSSCASSGGAGAGGVGGGAPGGPGAGGRILYSLPGGLGHHYSALQASMSSGDNFIQGRNLSGLLPMVSRGHDGMPGSRVWTSFQVLPSASSMGQQSGVSVQGSHDISVAARHSDKVEGMAGGVEEQHGSNNEHGGASFAEHDYMSDVSSAPAEEKCGERVEGKGEDAQDTDSNLNLRETELRLGPPESCSGGGGEAKNALLSGAKRGFSEAMGSLSECKAAAASAAAAAAGVGGGGDPKRGFLESAGINGLSPSEGARSKPAEQRPRMNNNSLGGYSTDPRVSMMIVPGNPPSSFTDLRGGGSCFLDSRGGGGVFEHQGGFKASAASGVDGDGKGCREQQQQGKTVGVCGPSGFRVPSLPPPWQSLDQAAASLGPFPSPKVLDGDDASCRNASAPVVGWPPVRAFRKSTLPSPPTSLPLKGTTESPGAVSAAAASSPAAAPATATAAPGGQQQQQLLVGRAALGGEGKVMRGSADNGGGCRGNGGAASSVVTSNYWFVKVYMDGVPFGRKVDLRIHGCYEKLSVGLEEMFTRYANVEQGSNGESKPLKFLQGSDYVLTYEDQDGDLMLVGDVPWNMFVTSVKRLRIMKSSEAVGIAPRNSPKLWKGGAT